MAVMEETIEHSGNGGAVAEKFSPVVHRSIRSQQKLRMLSTISGSFESLRSVKSLERLSKEQSNDQATDQSGTVDFFFSQGD
jgi:hypothetical protein